jgi:CubicO group peptidase (beta-lactamase class C family)
MNWSHLETLVTQHLGKTFPAAQIEILVGGKSVYSNAWGLLNPANPQSPITNLESRFDLASVSKLFTVAAFMTFVEQGRVPLDQPVREVLSDFSGERAITPYPDPLQPGLFVSVVPENNLRANADTITFRNLLTHNSGLPAWLPLWKLDTREARRDTALRCDFSYPPGMRVVYSDIGLITLGFALEKLAGQSLDATVRERVTTPLGLKTIGYGPIPCDNVAPTEFYAHQNRRMCGEVHDENAWSLGGVAGHAGVFGTARDVAAFGEMYRRGGTPLFKKETVQEMMRLQSQDGGVRRGIGFALWSPDPEAASNPLSEKSFGHLGFTGTSLWIDPTRNLVVACLTNRVYYGRNNANAIGAFRIALHRAIVESVDRSKEE